MFEPPWLLSQREYFELKRILYGLFALPLLRSAFGSIWIITLPIQTDPQFWNYMDTNYTSPIFIQSSEVVPAWKGLHWRRAGGGRVASLNRWCLYILKCHHSYCACCCNQNIINSNPYCIIDFGSKLVHLSTILVTPSSFLYPTNLNNSSQLQMKYPRLTAGPNALFRDSYISREMIFSWHYRSSFAWQEQGRVRNVSNKWNLIAGVSLITRGRHVFS